MAINQSPLDAWTAVHALAGLGVGALGISAPVALGGAALYEVAEYAHEYPRGSAFFGSKRPESIPNVLADLAVYGAGYWLLSQEERNIPAAVVLLGLAGVLAYTLMPRN